MTRMLDLEDIQGNVIRGYGRYNFPTARYFFVHIAATAAGREFVEAVRQRVTTAKRWTRRADGSRDSPPVTLNIAFSFRGLLALGLPTRTLQRFPNEFIDGMKARSHILGDRDPRVPSNRLTGWDAHWDRVWRENGDVPGADVHVWLSMNAKVIPGTAEPVPELEQQTQWLRSLCDGSDGAVRLLATNGAAGDQEYQAASTIFVTSPEGALLPTPKEHFGYTDGIGDPVFHGQLPAEDERQRVKGRGKWMSADTGWEPLATGEFLLGHPDEAQELAPYPPPETFGRNGTFMVYRKLHENVSSFRTYFSAQAKMFAEVMGVPEAEAAATLKAKVAGRWEDGVPLTKAPTHADWLALRRGTGMDDPDPAKAAAATATYLRSADVVDFRYGDDMHGYKCPVTSHLRRANTRDLLDPDNTPDGPNANATTRLNKRRRIMRRGLPYGARTLGEGTDDSEQGIIFMAICSSLFRQFEFVQQQWIQYGLDFNVGNDTCPLIGDHTRHDKFVIPSDPATGQPPFLCRAMPNFVETRGGEYFFIPSMTALRMIAMGVVDPT